MLWRYLQNRRPTNVVLVLRTREEGSGTAAPLMWMIPWVASVWKLIGAAAASDRDVPAATKEIGTSPGRPRCQPTSSMTWRMGPGRTGKSPPRCVRSRWPTTTVAARAVPEPTATSQRCGRLPRPADESRRVLSPLECNIPIVVLSLSMPDPGMGAHRRRDDPGARGAFAHNLRRTPKLGS